MASEFAKIFIYILKSQICRGSAEKKAHTGEYKHDFIFTAVLGVDGKELRLEDSPGDRHQRHNGAAKRHRPYKDRPDQVQNSRTDPMLGACL